MGCACGASATVILKCPESETESEPCSPPMPLHMLKQLLRPHFARPTPPIIRLLGADKNGTPSQPGYLVFSFLNFG